MCNIHNDVWRCNYNICDFYQKFNCFITWNTAVLEKSNNSFLRTGISFEHRTDKKGKYWKYFDSKKNPPFPNGNGGIKV